MTKVSKYFFIRMVFKVRWFAAILFLSFIINQNLPATKTQKDSIINLIKTFRQKAKKCDKVGDIYNAIGYYEKYLFYKSKDVKLTYRLATLYFMTRNYSKARQYYDSVLTMKPEKYPFSFYYKGIVCMNLEDYDAAIESFSKFKKVYKKKNDPEEMRKQANNYIESSEWAKTKVVSNDKILISHPGENLNHKSIDFSPFPVNEHNLLYGAVYEDTSKHIYPVRQIYKAEKIKGQWQTTGMLEGMVNNPEFNTGNAVISADGQRIYFTRNRKNWKNKDISEIYVSNLYDGTWQEPQKLPYPINDESYTTTQPAISVNLKTEEDILYFVSDRPGGKGGLDIWCTEYSKKINGFKEPKVLDKGVNTIGNECCPFYDISTGTLYFSSTGRNGLGGYDIYKSSGSTKKFTEAEALPKPINSSFDDYYFSIFSNNKEGFFTSNRPGAFSLGNGSCCDDIFYYKINECAKINAWGVVRNSSNYDFYNHLNEKYHLGLVYPENNAVLPDVPIELYLAGNKEGEEILVSKSMTNTEGKYTFELERNKQYKILVKNYGFFEKKVSVSTLGADCADTLKIGVTHLSYLPKINISINIYYEHDKSRLTPEAKQTIDTSLMPLFDLFPNAIIEIGSHTDSTGTDSYNMKLSQRRSESVVNYLISKGIPDERLVAKGYGMRIPIAPNTNPDGSDNPEGRQLNRRTVMKIVGEISNFYKDE